MQPKWLLFFGLLAATRAATIFHGEIPVKVIYDEEVTHRLYVRNLDKKTQEEVQKLVSTQDETKEKQRSEAASKIYANALRNHGERSQLSEEEAAEVAQKLRIVTPPEAPAVKPQEELDDKKLFDRIQEIIYGGVQRIKDDLKTSQEVVQPEVWNSFNDGVEGFLKSVRNRSSLRQTSNTTSILDQFQHFASNFFGQFNPQNQNPNASQDSQQPGFPQTVASFFQNGISQIQQSLNTALSGQNNPATILGDNPSTSRPNPIQGLVQQAQHTFSNLFNPQQQGSADQTSSPNPIQSISNSIGQALQGLNPFNNRPGAAGDESSTQGGPLQAFQNVLNNLNPFQQTTVKPADSSSSNPIPTIPPILNPLGGNTTIPNLQNVGQQISETISNNPLQGVAQQIGSAIPGNPLQIDNNPLQGVAQQIGAAIPGNPLQSGSNPIDNLTQQIAGAVPSNPIQSGTNPIETIAQQAGSLVPGNPIQSGNNPIQALVPNRRK